MNERMSAAEFRAQPAEKPKRNKYNAKRTLVDGMWFDSQREAEVYGDFKLLERAGRVSGFTRQRKFELIVNGQIIGTYRADFCFIDHDRDGKFRAIDVKGVITKDFRRTQKIIKAAYGIDVEVMK